MRTSLVVSAFPRPGIQALSSPVVPTLLSPVVSVVPNLRVSALPSPVVLGVLPLSAALPVMANTILCVWATNTSSAPSEVAATAAVLSETSAFPVTAKRPSPNPLPGLSRPRRLSLDSLPALSWLQELSLNSALGFNVVSSSADCSQVRWSQCFHVWWSQHFQIRWSQRFFHCQLQISVLPVMAMEGDFKQCERVALCCTNMHAVCCRFTCVAPLSCYQKKMLSDNEDLIYELAARLVSCRGKCDMTLQCYEHCDLWCYFLTVAMVTGKRTQAWLLLHFHTDWSFCENRTFKTHTCK